ncbi:MAG: winged helix-turn-helix transcriptional regulator [Euryarchaeota archaeon]|nr:winged helix-turn-helix transcriptional regulator [Euryarchaeota archaeon]
MGKPRHGNGGRDETHGDRERPSRTPEDADRGGTGWPRKDPERGEDKKRDLDGSGASDDSPTGRAAASHVPLRVADHHVDLTPVLAGLFAWPPLEEVPNGEGSDLGRGEETVHALQDAPRVTQTPFQDVVSLIPVDPRDLPIDLHKLVPTRRPSSDELLERFGASRDGADSFLASTASLLPSPAHAVLETIVCLVAGAVASVAAFYFGFRHVTAGNALSQGARRRILNGLRESPGIGLRALANEVALSPATVHHHLRQLERVGMVKKTRVAGKTLCYPCDGAATRLDAVRSAFERDAISKAMLAYLEDASPRSQTEIARALELAHGSVQWRIWKLVEAGLVEEVHGRAFRLNPAGSHVARVQ